MKKIKEKKISTVELVTYTIKAVIPTAMYSNIQPEIVVKAGSIAEAEAVVLPYIDKLFEKYQEGNRNKSSVTVKETPAKPSVKAEEKTSSVRSLNHPDVIITGTEAVIKAGNAIIAALSIPALDLIEERIKVSDKITEVEKPELFTLLLKKKKEINEKKT